MRRPAFLLLFALVFSGLAVGAARADCTVLEALIKNDGSKEISEEHSGPEGFRAAIEACGDPSMLGLLYDRNAAETATPVTEIGEMAGHWVNDYWLHVAFGLSVPAIEMLEIARDGRLERRVLRFYDSSIMRHLDDPGLEMVLPDYTPLLAEGTVSRDANGGLQVVGLTNHAYVADAQLKERSPEQHQMQVQMALIAMPDIARPFEVARAGNVLVIRDARGEIRTYRRFDRLDVERLHAVIMAAEISASRNWSCLRDRMFAGAEAQAELRAAGDFALKIMAAQDALDRLSAEAYNAALKDPELPGTPDGVAMKSIADEIGALYSSPEGQAFVQLLEDTSRFGCS